jgi:hypothetical protein
MPEPAQLREIDVDLAANTLRLVFGEPGDRAVSRASLPATIDIGTGGRLIGVELESGYVELMPAEPGTEHLSRSAAIEVAVERERGSDALLAVTVPRRGHGYEITWPSGNE